WFQDSGSHRHFSNRYSQSPLWPGGIGSTGESPVVQTRATARTDTPTSWEERGTVLTMLRYTRDTAAARCEAIAVEQVGATPLPTSPHWPSSDAVSRRVPVRRRSYGRDAAPVAP